MKIILSFLFLLAWAVSLPAQITRKQANEIVLDYLKNEGIQTEILYINVNTPDNEGLVISTSNEETVKVKYACWVYYLKESEFSKWNISEFFKCRYLLVKEDNGSLLEVIAYNDSGKGDSDSWEIVDISSGITEKEDAIKQPYPNPINDRLTVPCKGETVRVEIYNLYGTRLFCGFVSGNGACQLNVSFLNSGIYILKVDGQTYKIIKS